MLSYRFGYVQVISLLEIRMFYYYNMVLFPWRSGDGRWADRQIQCSNLSKISESFSLMFSSDISWYRKNEICYKCNAVESMNTIYNLENKTKSLQPKRGASCSAILPPAVTPFESSMATFWLKIVFFQICITTIPKIFFYK